MKKILIILLSIFLLTLGSCNDFLSQINPNELSTGNFWTNLTDCDNGVTAIYNAFKNPDILCIRDENLRSDMGWPGFGRPNPSDMSSSYFQTFTEASETPNAKWAALYTGVFRANQAIAGLNKIRSNYNNASDIKRWDNLMGQALFFRGLFHYYLYTSFNNGNVITYNNVPVSQEDFYKKTTPASEVIKFVRADMEQAKKLLPAIWSFYNDKGELSNPADGGRVTSGAASAILGQSYLYEKNYEKAREYLSDVIKNPDYGYQLVNIGDNFTSKGELNKESILEINYSLNYKPTEETWTNKGTASTLNLTFAPAAKGGGRTLIPSCWLIMAYKNEEIDTNDSRNKIFDASGNFVKYRKYSLRTSNSIALIDDENTPYYGAPSALQSVFTNKETAYFKKYTNWDTRKEESDIQSSRSGINIRVLRLSDIYLLYAEALIEGGNTESGCNEALKYINKVRHRSALKLLGSSANSEFPNALHDEKQYDAHGIMEHLMYVERPLELSIEGHATRTIDMRRWGITKKRFEDLATRRYYAVTYSGAVTDLGEPTNEWASLLQEGEITSDETMFVYDLDFVVSSKNYRDDQHAYWPIPLNEIVANPKVLEK